MLLYSGLITDPDRNDSFQTISLNFMYLKSLFEWINYPGIPFHVSRLMIMKNNIFFMIFRLIKFVL